MPLIPYMIAATEGSDPADEWMRLGVEAQQDNNLALAQKRYQHALRLDPRHALAMNNLAIVYAQGTLMAEALLTIERASMCDGVHGVIETNWALMVMDCERPDEAIEHAQKAVKLAPDDPTAKLTLAMMLTIAGGADESVRIYNTILDAVPTHPSAGLNACFIQTLTDVGPAELLRQRRRWWEANRYTGPIEPHRNDPNPDRTPLRVGYVGGDFKSHSAAFIFGRVLLHHTPAVEMYVYSNLPVKPDTDVLAKRFQDAAPGRWRDIAGKCDEDVAALIRKDKIDILVDLSAHSHGGRLAVFTRKPAPVQVTAWGFAHGTGCPEIDYFLADKVSIPEDEREHYAEKIIDLPCLVTLEEPTHYQLKGTSLPPIQKNGYFTFGTYARFEKISDECLAAFAEILRRVPDSKLEFKDAAMRRPDSLRRILRIMDGIAPERLLFSLSTTHPDHMLAYQQADLILDPWPHCGGVVSLEMLYMGVPMITRYGKQPAGRNTSSVLTAMGRTEWIAKSVSEYIDKAVEWSGRLPDLARARLTLRQELFDSPVVAGYVEAVEAVYRSIWRRWCDQ